MAVPTQPAPMDWRDQLAAIAGLSVSRDEPMSAHTSYRVGGPAAAWVDVATADALSTALQTLQGAGVPWLVMGNGSNVLFADAGFRGAVLHPAMGGDLSAVRVDKDALGPGRHLLEVGAALSVTRLLRFAKAELLDGVSYLGGVPGTLGGAVRMNAGTRAGEVSDTLVSAQVVQVGQAPRWIPAADLGLSYRHSELPEGAVVTAARFEVHDAGPEMRAQLDDVLAYRKRTQPLTFPSCGSVFANPPGDAAGRLIEACGLKGRTIGGAQVSEQHANWIVNCGGATAADVLALIELCVREVQSQQGVTLRHEVQRLGDWPGTGDAGGQP